MDKLQALKQIFGHSAFRPGQEALIDALLTGQDALGIMPTGAGKSMCFQIPSLVRDGVALVVSPLISLMKDQVMALIQAGVAAAYINSSLSPAQCSLALQRARQGAYRIIYVAPERLLTPSFLSFAQQAKLSMIAVDEAHCVSQWGQDFRPSYLSIPEFLGRLPQRPPVGAYTATATRQVKEDIIRLLGLEAPLVRVTGFDRPGLKYAVRQPKDKDGELLAILQERRGRSGIIYCATRRNVDSVCDLLRQQGYAAARYHAGMADTDRHQAQDDFQYDRAQVMVATNAFGMGIDKSNVHYVIHYNMPRNLESYYQEAGRAGRDGAAAECILLYQKRDVVLQKWMIEHSEQNSELTPAQRDQLQELELERLKQMTFYAAGRRCLRQSILRYFGEESKDHCGNCSVCLGEPRERRLTAQAQPRPAAPPSVMEQRFAALRALRNTIAKEKGIPAYAVFTDATLREMALMQPRTPEQLLGVSGVGDKKLESFGELFLTYLQRLVAEPEAWEQAATQQLMKRALDHYRDMQPWKQEEVRRLKAQVAQGQPLSAIALQHKRSEQAVEEKMLALKLKPRL